MRASDGGQDRTRVIYVSPLKALGYDIERNLRVPLSAIPGAEEITVGIRTGDTSQKERAALLRHPPDILITTPESLYLMLTSRARETLAGVESVILDEIHAVAASKRGSHLMLTLERLEELVRANGREEPLQRIGLSATQRPIEEIGRFLGGASQPEGGSRPVTIVEAQADKPLDLQVVVPVADLRDPETDPMATPPTPRWPSPATPPAAARSGPASIRACSRWSPSTTRRSCSSTTAAWPSGSRCG